MREASLRVAVNDHQRVPRSRLSSQGTPPPARSHGAPRSPTFRSGGAWLSPGSSPVLIHRGSGSAQGRFWITSVKQTLPPRPPSPIPGRGSPPRSPGFVFKQHRLESLDEDVVDDDDDDDYIKEESYRVPEAYTTGRRSRDDSRGPGRINSKQEPVA